MSNIKNLLMFVLPFMKYHLSGHVQPILAGYKITNRCNLRCSHCPYWKRSGPELGFDGVIDTMRRLRACGAKILILEGGEPLMWRDGKRSIADVVVEARKLFPCVCMTTNGTIRWDHLPLNRVWVSLDGSQEMHDSIRGAGVFDKVINNLQKCGQRKALISSTISKQNVRSLCELIVGIPHLISGLTVQFYYPYEGLPDPLYIESHERAEILDELIALKKRGYPVANSFGGLNELKKERWTCEDGLLINADPDGSVSVGCYLKNRGQADCSRCGFSAHNEMSRAFKGRLDSVLCGLTIFFGGSKQQTF